MTGHMLSSRKKPKTWCPGDVSSLSSILAGSVEPPRSIGRFLATAEASFLIVLTGRDVLGFMKTARALGLSMPPAPRARADVVI